MGATTWKVLGEKGPGRQKSLTMSQKPQVGSLTSPFDGINKPEGLDRISSLAFLEGKCCVATWRGPELSRLSVN